MTVYNSYVGYYIPMSVFAAMFLTISLELPDSSCQAQSVKYAFPIYRSSSLSFHPCGLRHGSENGYKDSDYFSNIIANAQKKTQKALIFGRLE
jgi:hypothetical protein